MSEVLANISGSVSLACWTTILLPQLVEQWRRKSSEGMSIHFLLLWLFGDFCSLSGGWLAHLRPGVILLAGWFVFTDALLLASCFYYRTPRFPAPDSERLIEPEERQFVNSTFLGKWGSTLAYISVVSVVSVVSYFISSQEEQPVQKSAVSSILGYIAAVMYLVARLPQIYQNHERKSVEGLSIGFFALSILGNLTYAGQILFMRTDAEWVIEYMPWLLGSLGTILEDLVIFGQFSKYSANSSLNL